MSETPRVGQTCIKYVGSDRYAGKIVKIEGGGDIIHIKKDGHDDSFGTIRCKKNRKSGGYGEQTMDKGTGKWKYKHIAKYRGFSTWMPIEGESFTRLDPGF